MTQREGPAYSLSRVSDGEIIRRRRRRRATVAEDVAAQLRDEIRSGVLRPGDHLPQNDTAERLEVSVTPVREAFVILEREGLVQRFHQRGVVVFQPTIEDLAACFEIRSVLEALAAQHAVDNLTDEDLEELRSILTEMEGLTTEDRDRYVELNGAFHRRIEAAAQIPRLATLIDDQRATTNTYLLLSGQQSSAAPTEFEHSQILEALTARDRKAAWDAMFSHLQARKHASVAHLGKGE